MQVLANNIAFLAGIFFLPIFFLTIGFIVKKSTGKLWGYHTAAVVLIIQLILMAIYFIYKT
jgi:Kef-type K+ transport system membrane component KefB